MPSLSILFASNHKAEGFGLYAFDYDDEGHIEKIKMFEKPTKICLVKVPGRDFELVSGQQKFKNDAPEQMDSKELLEKREFFLKEMDLMLELEHDLSEEDTDIVNKARQLLRSRTGSLDIA